MRSDLVGALRAPEAVHTQRPLMLLWFVHRSGRSVWMY